MAGTGKRGGQTRARKLGQGKGKPTKGGAKACRSAWRDRMRKHGFAMPWRLSAARRLRDRDSNYRSSK